MGNTWKVVVAFVGVFVAGTVFGGFFALGVGQRVIEARRPAAPPTDPMLLQRYVKSLDLTEVQTTKIKPILDKVQSDVNEIRRQATIDTAAVLRPIVEKAEVDLKKLLTPEQIAKLGDIEKSRGLQLDGQGRGRGGPPPGGSQFNRSGGGGGQGGNPNFPGGPGGRGQRGPGGQGGGISGGGRGGFPGQPSTDPKAVPATPVAPTVPAPAGN